MKILSADWKAAEELVEEMAEETKDKPMYFRLVDTQSDDFAVAASETPITTEEVRAYFDEHGFEEE